MGRLCLTKFFCFFLTLCLISSLFLGLAPSVYALEWSSTDSSNLAKIANSLYTSSTVTAVSRLTDIYNIVKYSASNSNSPLYPIYNILNTWNGTKGYMSYLTNLEGIKSALDTLKTSASTSTSTFYPMYQKLDSMNTNIGDIETALTGTGAGSIKKYLSDMQSGISSLSFSVSSVSSPFYSLYSDVDAIHKLFTYDTSYSVSVFGSSSRTLTYYGLHNALIGALNQVIDGLTFIGTQDTSDGGSVILDTLNTAATDIIVETTKRVTAFDTIVTINDKLGDVQFTEFSSYFFNLPDDIDFSLHSDSGKVYHLTPTVTFTSDPSHSSATSILFTIFSSGFSTFADSNTGGGSSGNYFYSSYHLEVPPGTYTFPAGFCPTKYSNTAYITSAPSGWESSPSTISLPSGGIFVGFSVYYDGVVIEDLTFPLNGFTVYYDAPSSTFSGFTNLFQRIYNDISLLASFFGSPSDLQRKEDQKDVVNDVLGDGVSGGTKVKVSDVKSVAGTASTLLGLLSSPAKVTDLPDAIDDALSAEDGPLSWFSQDTASDLDSVVSPASLDPSQEIVTSYYDDQLQEVLDWFSQR